MKKNDAKIDEIISLTKTVEKYQRTLKPYTKSSNGLKSNFFGSQKKELDILNSKISHYSNESKKIRMKITFLYPLNDIEALKSEIKTKETKLEALNTEIDTMHKLIGKQLTHLNFLEESSSKQSSEAILYKEYNDMKVQCSNLSLEKNSLENEYKELIKREVDFQCKRTKLLEAVHTLNTANAHNNSEVVEIKSILEKQTSNERIKRDIEKEEELYNSELRQLKKELARIENGEYRDNMGLDQENSSFDNSTNFTLMKSNSKAVTMTNSNEHMKQVRYLSSEGSRINMKESIQKLHREIDRQSTLANNSVQKSPHPSVKNLRALDEEFAQKSRPPLSKQTMKTQSILLPSKQSNLKEINKQSEDQPNPNSRNKFGTVKLSEKSNSLYLIHERKFSNFLPNIYNTSKKL